MEFEAPTRDLSQLSVSDDHPPPAPRKLEPMDFSKLYSGSIGFTAGKNCDDFSAFFAGKGTHNHVIEFYSNNFTVNGGPVRDGNDPINIKFLEDIKNYIIPEEFAEDGIHTIRLLRHREAAPRIPLATLAALYRVS
ncbi:hypothetical protein MKW94_021920 [Papaver nudicaule]|uniref:SEP domain-containing protein n=1 Tax=Papaver nudicaule TaxID=74823 RepID=A0AA41VLE3_PAPNU|nr:hypothetical protein [Papaver nudicaule]